MSMNQTGYPDDWANIEMVGPKNRLQTELFPLTDYTDITIEVPASPSLQVAVGDTITTHVGTATVTDIAVAGQEQIIFADYGSGIAQSHITDTIEAVSSPPEQLTEPSNPNPRRHTPKGEASGWIEERTGNKKRKNPSVSHYYCWDDADGRHRKYIPAKKLWRVQQMWEGRRSVDEIMKYLNHGRR